MPKPTKKKPAPKRPVAKHANARADYGQPIDGFIAKQKEPIRSILVTLRRLAEGAAPGAQAALKWGMPFYSVDGKMTFALGAHKAHVNLILAGPADAYADPKGRLEGSSKKGRHLKVTAVSDIPKADVQKWVRTAMKLARTK